jgi:hypothetical protein
VESEGVGGGSREKKKRFLENILHNYTMSTAMYKEIDTLFRANLFPVYYT